MRGKLIERYATIIAIIVLFALSYSLWTWKRVRMARVEVKRASGPEQPSCPLPHEQPEAPLLALPDLAAEERKDDGFIPVPEDGQVPAGSSVRLDMSTGKRTYKPAHVVDDIHDHRDYVDMEALRKLHQQSGGVPKEQSKWKQEFKGVRKQIEDLLLTLSPTMPTEQALLKIEKLEDYVISTMSNAGGIFHSDHFTNLVKMLEHEQESVRLATASLLFYSCQNNVLTSESLLKNVKALTIIASTMSREQNINVLYKCVSLMNSALDSCAFNEQFKTFISNVKNVDLFTIMANRIDSMGNTAGAEKVLSTLAIVAEKAEDDSCLILLEHAIGKTGGLPKTLINKIISPLCPAVNTDKHPRLFKQCRSH